MNQSFMEIKSKIDSINSMNDSLQSVVICEISENDKLREEVIYSYKLINKEYRRERRLGIIKNSIVITVAFTSFTLIAMHLNTL